MSAAVNIEKIDSQVNSILDEMKAVLSSPGQNGIRLPDLGSNISSGHDSTMLSEALSQGRSK